MMKLRHERTGRMIVGMVKDGRKARDRIRTTKRGLDLDRRGEECLAGWRKGLKEQVRKKY